MVNLGKPFVTIVILIGSQRRRAERSLASVLKQDDLDQAEIILLDVAHDKFPPIQGSEHPAVRVIDSTHATSYGVLRAKGAELARGDIVAYLEDHAQATQGWLNSLIRGFNAGHAGIGGRSQISNPGVGLSDLFALVSYTPPQIRPSEPYSTDILPNQNSAYRRELLLSFGDQLPTLLSSDHLLSRMIVAKGHTLLLDPNIVVVHANLENIQMISGNYFHWNVIFGKARADVLRWSWLRRIVQILSTPLLPFLRYSKILRQVYIYEKGKLPQVIRYTFSMLYVQSVAAIAISIGCLFDVKNSEKKYLFSELNWDHHQLSH